MNHKKLKNKNQRYDKRTVDLITYTETSYFQCFPTSTDENYFDFLVKDDLEQIHFLEQQYENLYISGIRKVIIDDEYFTWLESEKIKNTSENRIQYANRLSDEEVLRIWKKNDMEAATLIRVLPFIIASKKVLPVSNINLSEALVANIQNILALSTGLKQEQLYIHQQLLSVHSCNEDFLEGDFYEKAHNIFTTGLRNRLANVLPIETQTNQTLIFRFLPIAVKDIENCFLSRKELEKETWVERDLPEQKLEKWARKACRHLGDDLNIYAFPTFLDQMEIESFCENFIESLGNEAIRKGISITTAK